MIIKKVPSLNTYMPNIVKSVKAMIAHASHTLSHEVDINSHNQSEKAEILREVKWRYTDPCWGTKLGSISWQTPKLRLLTTMLLFSERIICEFEPRLVINFGKMATFLYNFLSQNLPAMRPWRMKAFIFSGWQPLSPSKSIENIVWLYKIIYLFPRL